jgi:hypothetical protein
MEWTSIRLLNWGASIGVSAEAIVAHLLTNRRIRKWDTARAWDLLSLSRTSGKRRLEAVCRRALMTGAN